MALFALRPSRPRLAPLGAAGAVAAAGWFGPQLVTRGALRKRWMAGLAGWGNADGIALTFDDGPDPASTPAVMDRLEALGWKATFFLLGSLADAHPTLVSELVSAGHEVAVHGYRHRSHLWRSPAWVRDDVARATSAVATASGTYPRWYRPPHGSITPATQPAARAAGLQTVLWSTWGRDWRPGATGGTVMAEINRTLRGGGTVLLHDSDCTSAPGSWRATVAALPLLGDEVARRGLQVRPLGAHGISAAADSAVQQTNELLRTAQQDKSRRPT